MRTIRGYRDGLRTVLEKIPLLSQIRNMQALMSGVLEQLRELLDCQDGLIYLDASAIDLENAAEKKSDSYFSGMGIYEGCTELGRTSFDKISQSGSLLIDKEEHVHMAALCAEGGRPFGVVMVHRRTKVPEEKAQLFAVYVKQVGGVMGNLIYQSLLQRQNEELNKA